MNTDRIEKHVLLHTTLDRAWRAVSDSREFGTWFGMRIDGPFVAGTKMRCAIAPTAVNDEVAAAQKPYEGKSFEISIEDLQPKQLFSFRWNPYAVEPDVDYSKEPTTLVTFTLEEKPDGVLLTVVESGFDRIPLARRAKAFAANEGGWTMQMKLIEAWIARPE